MKQEIWHGDCLELMKNIPKESVDMIITSPPYDDLRTYNGTLNWSERVWQEIFKNCFDVLKNGGVLVWVVGDKTDKGSETGTSFRQALYAKEIGFNLHDTMIYMKDNPPPTGGADRYFQSFEYMFVFSKGAPKTFNPIKSERRNKHGDKRQSRIRPVVRNRDGVFEKKKVVINQGEVKLQNIWSYTVSGGRVAEDRVAHKHPAIFPEQLASDHILSWTNEGDLVLDPLAGSGTTLVVAKKLNRKFIGIEKEQEYYNICLERLK